MYKNKRNEYTKEKVRMRKIRKLTFKSTQLLKKITQLMKIGRFQNNDNILQKILGLLKNYNELQTKIIRS